MTAVESTSNCYFSSAGEYSCTMPMSELWAGNGPFALVQATDINVQVTAQNVIGLGDPSDTDSSLQVKEIPEAPGQPTGSATSYDTIEIILTEATLGAQSGNVALADLSYEVEYRFTTETNADYQKYYDDTFVTTHTWTHLLRASTSYMFRYRVTNIYGDSE